MIAEFFPSTAYGEVVATPSKSMTHRYLICAGLSEGESIVKKICLSEDIKATLSCLEKLGAKVKVNKDEVEIFGFNPFFRKEVKLDCNESGSTLRFLLPLCLLSESKTIFTGKENLFSRPMEVYEELLKKNGTSYIKDKNSIETKGILNCNHFEIRGDISSQFISGLLFMLPLLKNDSEIIIVNKIESRSYIDLTLDALSQFGIKANWENENIIKVIGNQKYIAKNLTVEGDYSNASFYSAFNLIGGEVNVLGLNENSKQGDKVYLDYFYLLNKENSKISLSDCPDLGPILFSMAGVLNGATFTDINRLKIKESNRISSMIEELNKLNIKTEERDNELVVFPSKIKRPKENLNSHNDHRVLMALSILLSIVGGKIENIEAVNKSEPDFFDKIKKLNVDFILGEN